MLGCKCRRNSTVSQIIQAICYLQCKNELLVINIINMVTLFFINNLRTISFKYSNLKTHIHTQCGCTICKFEYLWNIITSSFENKFTRFQRSSKSITRTRRTLPMDELKAAPTTARKEVDNIQVMHINDQPISDTV